MFAPRMTYARRQQYRHRVRSDGYLLSGALVLLVGLSASRIRETRSWSSRSSCSGPACFGAARRSQRLAERWRVGADSERAVQHALKELAGSGWVVRNGVRWPGGGDIDHLVRSPDGVGFAIETKTRTFRRRALRRTAATARWAAQRRRRYPRGVVPVLCVVRAHGVECRYGDVVVVSLDRLLALLERTALSASRSERPVGGRWSKRRVRCIDSFGLNPIRARVAGPNDG